jgi:hypothetical protein
MQAVIPLMRSRDVTFSLMPPRGFGDAAPCPSSARRPSMRTRIAAEVMQRMCCGGSWCKRVTRARGVSTHRQTDRMFVAAEDDRSTIAGRVAQGAAPAYQGETGRAVR